MSSFSYLTFWAINDISIAVDMNLREDITNIKTQRLAAIAPKDGFEQEY